MKNVLILGGAGFVGANLARHCLSQGDIKLTIVDSLDSHFHSSLKNLEAIMPEIKFIHGDLRDESMLAKVVPNQDVIFNCAAQTSHPLSMELPALDVEINCLGNIRLLEAVRLFNPKAYVVYTSSSTTIGKAIHPIVDEDHPERPLEIYSANKGVAEKYYRIYHTAFGLNTIVLRLANLFGPYGKGYPEFSFVNYFIDLAWKNEPIKLYGSGQQIRNITFIDDISDLLWRCWQEPSLLGQMHFAVSDQHLSVREIAESIIRIFGRGEITYIEWPEKRKNIEIDNVKISSERLKKRISWNPKYDLSTGLEKIRTLLQSKGSEE